MSVAEGRHQGAWRPWLLAGVPLVLACIAYANTLHDPFVYDDDATVVQNPSLRTPGNLALLLSYSPFRPLVNISYALDFALGDLNPFGYHLTNLLLHLVNVGLLVVLARFALEDAGHRPSRAVALLPACLWAVHPVMTEAVGYVSARSELLGGLFFLVALLCFRQAVRTRRRRYWALGALAFVLLGASKEVVAALPFVALAWDRLLLRDSDPNRRLWRIHLPLIALVGVAAIVRVAVYVGPEHGEQVSFLANARVELLVIWRYAALLIVPVGQSIVHGFREEPTLFAPGPLLALVGLIAAGVVLWRLRRRVPLVVFGVLWWLLLLVPSAAVPLKEAMSEHRVYLASVGLFLAAAEGVLALARRLPHWWMGATAVLAGFLVLTIARNRVWADEVSLWSDAVAKYPGVYSPHYALADAWRERGDCPRAIQEYRAAIALLADEPDAHMNLGICLAQTGQPQLAQREFEAVLALNPKSAQAHFNLGLLARMTGAMDEARRQFEATLALDPNHPKARTLLGLP